MADGTAFTRAPRATFFAGDPPPPNLVPDITPQGVQLPDAVKPMSHPLEAITAVTKAWASKAAAQAANQPAAGEGPPTAYDPVTGSWHAGPPSNMGVVPDNSWTQSPGAGAAGSGLDGQPPGVWGGERGLPPGYSTAFSARNPAPTMHPPGTIPAPAAPPPTGAFIPNGPPLAAAADPASQAVVITDPNAPAAGPLPSTSLRSDTPPYDSMAAVGGPASAPVAPQPSQSGGAFRGGGAGPPAPAAGPLDGHDPTVVAATIAGTPAGQGLKANPASAFADAGFDEAGINKLYDELRTRTGHKGEQDLTSDDKAHIMMELGLSIMAAGGQHGATFLGAIGQGGLAAMGSYREMKAQKRADAMAADAADRDVIKTGLDIKMKQGELRGKALDAALTREQRALDSQLTREQRGYDNEQSRQLRRDMAAASIAARNPPAIDGRVQQVNDLIARGVKQDDAIEKVYGAKDSPLKDLDAHLDGLDKARAGAGQDPMSQEERQAAADGWIQSRKAAAAALSGNAPPPAPAATTAPAAGTPPIAGAVPWVQGGQKYWKGPDNKLYPYQ